MVFESGNVDSLYDKVRNLLDSPNTMQKLSQAAYYTVSEVWNPLAAAERLYEFCKSIMSGEPQPYSEGPLSIAQPIYGYL